MKNDDVKELSQYLWERRAGSPDDGIGINTVSEDLEWTLEKTKDIINKLYNTRLGGNDLGFLYLTFEGIKTYTDLYVKK
jgi:hypothetical protein